MVNTRSAIEKLYNGRCTVKIKAPATDPITKLTKQNEETTLFTDQPCRLSIKSITAASDDNIAKIAQAVILFIAPDIDIPAGSKIIVTQNGVTKEYARSGEAAVYSSHQEIPLELFDRYA